MRLLTYLFVLVIFSIGCDRNSDPEVIDVVEDMDPLEEFKDSPYYDFLGEWKLASNLLNGDIVDIGIETMVIEEDEVLEDMFAVGSYQLEMTEPEPMSFELTDNENGIIMQRGSLSFICSYEFSARDTLVFDDSRDDYSQFTTWVRQ